MLLKGFIWVSDTIYFLKMIIWLLFGEGLVAGQERKLRGRSKREDDIRGGHEK